MRENWASESQLKTASSCAARGFWEVCTLQLLCSSTHAFVAPFPRAKRSFAARVLIRLIVAVVALDFVENRQSEHSSSSS